jgi:hypothetical protein
MMKGKKEEANIKPRILSWSAAAAQRSDTSLLRVL